MEPLDYDPFSPLVMEDPLPVYRRLRDEAPACHIPRFDAYALSRFQDIWNASSDPRFSAAQGTTSSQLLTRTQPVTPMLNVMDPPEHTRLRGAVRQQFAPRALRHMEPVIRQIVRECIAKVRDRGRMDVVAELGAILSVRVTCLAVGIPLADADRLHDLVWRFFEREEGVEGMTAGGLAAAQELDAYFAALAAERRRAAAPRGDAIDMLIGFESDGRRLADAEIASHLAMLVIGGSETFPKTLATAVLRLWQHPDQRAECAADPARIPAAYDECLRYDMPTQFLGRTLLEDVTLHGVTLRRGRPVLFLYPSANRDEREFPDPDRFDIHRRAPRILTFGAGTHACLGLHVAKWEGRICLEELLREFPGYEVDLAGARRLRTEFVQGYDALPIALAG